MLTAARSEKAGGRDVVAGLVETHGRRETEQLIDGFEVLPRKPIVYRNQVMKEFDLDAALARRPSLLLVDEYAHTNVPGSRHPKRWQDIDELLARRHRRLDHAQHPASRKPQRRRPEDHQGAGARDRARHGVRQGRRDRAGRLSARRTAQAPRRRQGLCPGHRRPRRREFLQAAESDRAARTGAAPRRRADRRRSDRAHAGAGDRRAVGGRRAHPRLHRARSDLADRRAHRQAARRPDGRAVDRRDRRAAGRQPRWRRAPAARRGDEAGAKASAPRRRR